MMGTMHGRYSPKNPSKYKGNVMNIVYRSSWELKFCVFCDLHEEILSWSSESVIVPYISPVDNRRHRYYPDFLITEKDTEGNIKTIMIEIKPQSQTKPPTVKKRATKKYLTECVTYSKNQAKWDAARTFCKRRGWDFMVLTEKEIMRGEK